MKRKRLTFTTKMIIIISAIILSASILLSMVLFWYSRRELRANIEARMLDVTNAAAALLNGDELKTLEADDKGNPEYERVYHILGTFQQSIELSYIYAVRDMGDGTFTFTIDPDPEDPAYFGQPIEITDALIVAGKGTPAVDQKPSVDEWGKFYSAYSPVFDSEGNVAGIVGVDFSAEWYDRQMKKNLYVVVIVGAMSLILGSLVGLVIANHIRRQFNDLVEDVGNMAEDLHNLTTEAKSRVKQETSVLVKEDKPKPQIVEADKPGDYLDKVRSSIHSMHEELKEYLSFVQKQAYLDTMTGLKNKTAYLETVGRLEQSMAEGTARFAVIVFDINGLKKVNDNFGHEQGDRMIISAARVIKKAFGKDCVYRIGGDEFIAVVNSASDMSVRDAFYKMDGYIAEENKTEPPLAGKLAISRGVSFYTSVEDKNYNSVFKRADNRMYHDKVEYYKTHAEESNAE